VRDGEATFGEVTPYQRSLEVGRAIKAMEYMVKLHARDPKVPEGTDPSVMEAARAALGELKATDVAAAMMTANVPGEMSLVLWNRARRALFALAPVVVMRLADKIDDATAPGSERILSEVAKGLGLLVPGEPQDEEKRRNAITQKDLKDLSDEELEDRLRDERGGREP
jgi:hypothetical protein